MAGEEQLNTCAACGATIYPEHLQKRVAEHWEGQLLCPFCLKDKKSGSAAGMAAPLDGAAAIPLVELPNAGSKPIEEPIAYDKKPTAIRAFGGSPVGQRLAEAFGAQLQRPLQPGTPNATRCRIFHCKLADGPIAHMCEQINEWADADDAIAIKFATSTIGVVEGKHMDAHLIVTVFY
jgi:hypothetical protein